MSKKYEDGIWIGRYGNGECDFGVRFLVKEQSFARRLPDGTYGYVSCTFLPLNRVADLEGRPVVDEAVIEAIVKDIRKTELKLLGISLPIEELTDILHERLDARKDDLNARSAATAERPIVNLPGAFLCWWKDGTAGDYTAWPSCGGVRYMGNDGHSSGWLHTKQFDRHFTRTPPSPTLPPEHERLVGPIAKKLGKTETEVRDAILEAQGAGA